MFSIYGLTGPVFRGTREQLDEVRAVSRARGVRAVAQDRIETGPAALAAAQRVAPATGPGAEVAQTYEAIAHSDLDRGPLYRASQVMQRELIVVNAEDDVAAAWRTLRENRIHQSPVLDSAHRLVGIVSERNLLTALNVEDGVLRDVLARNVSDVMTSPVVSADPATDIRRIAHVMLDYDVDGVPVVDESHALVGFISRSDILRAVVADPPISLWR